MDILNEQLDNPIGLDISDISIKFVQLKKKGPNLEVSSYGDFILPTGLIDHDVIKDEAMMAKLLDTMFQERSKYFGKVVGNSVIASVPESKAYVRVITLPKLSTDELSTAVPLQAEQYIPLSIDKVEFAWQIVSETENGVDILITATPKDYIEQLVRIFKKANIIPKAIEVESSAVARCLIPFDNTAPSSLLVDLNAVRTSLIVHSNKSIQFTSSVPIAGEAVTSAISIGLNITLAEAEKLKRKYGVSLLSSTDPEMQKDDGDMVVKINNAVEPVLSNLFDEMKNTIKYYEDHSEKNDSSLDTIQQILLCGGSAKIPNIVDYFQNKINTDEFFINRKIVVSLGNPWLNLIKLGQPPFSRRDALSYTTSIGLALRNYIEDDAT